MANDKIDIEKVCQINKHEKNINFDNDKITDVLTKNINDNDNKIINEEIKFTLDNCQLKKNDDIQQVIRRKYSKEEFSNNTDDTDDAPNRRSSSHLSPEASPLSTRSSRYSPRESESEPTPALPRKTSGGDSCISSQRIRDAITRTRRESNSSTRYESSGSESIRFSESGLHNYVDLARKVRLFGNYYCTGASIDESIQRDSATTSAGEDEPHDDCLSRDSARLNGISNQGRTIIRRRRQFDSQAGTRRRGRSHARTCCSEDLQNLQSTRHNSQIHNHNQETPNPDYRRLVFISSDSSSGREEDDADSSCSSSSYLNGLPRNAQGLEDCDWDYFESGTLPLPTNLTDNTKIDNANIDNYSKLSQNDLSCCPGSVACVACGGSPGGKVLPVPVPIPVYMPIPVPVPASLWNVDFAAVANSMITGNTTPEGTLRLRGDPTAPWFSWHPRFNQQLQSPIQHDNNKNLPTFDSSLFTFKPDEQSSIDNNNLISNDIVTNDDKQKHHVENNETKIQDTNIASNYTEINNVNIKNDELAICMNEENRTMSSNDESVEVKKISTTCLSRSNSNSSSGRSSADSSDLDDKNSYHFSQVFVVNDDSYNSDPDVVDAEKISNEIATSENIDDENNGITLKHIISLSDDEPPIFNNNNNNNNQLSDDDDEDDDSETSSDESHELIDNNISIESNLTDSIENNNDNNNSHVQLRSIRRINPETGLTNQTNEHYVLNVQEIVADIKSWDSNVTPDSLEIIDANKIYNVINNDNQLKNNYKKKLTLSNINGDDDDNHQIDFKLNTSTESCSEINTTGNELSSNELHEYEVSCFDNNNLQIKMSNSSNNNNNSNSKCESTDNIHKQTPMPKEKSNFHKLEKINSIKKNNIVKCLLNIDKSIESNDNDNDNVNADDDDEKETIKINNNDKIIMKSLNVYDKEKDNIGLVKGEKSDSVGQVGDSEDIFTNGGNISSGSGKGSSNSGEILETSRFHSVERCPPTCKENGLLPSTLFTPPLQLPSTTTTTKTTPTTSTTTGLLLPSKQTKSIQNYSNINKYKSLVMITQGAYQPVSVVTSDTTTLLEPDETKTPQGLAGYYHLTLEAVTDKPRNGQPPRRPLMIKRSTPPPSTSSSSSSSGNTTEQEIDSGLSVGGSASESDDVQQQHQQQQQQCVKNLKHCLINTSVIQNNNSNNNEQIVDVGSNKKDDIVILEEGLADDDSWVEEVSHDEDEQSATATEESSEDEIHNIGGDREEELRGYHRQSIDFTLHTIVEESCEESEAEPSIDSNGLRKIKQRPPSTSDLEKYFFFGLGGDGNLTGINSNSLSHEIDSLSETSSIYSEGLESLNQDDLTKDKNSNDFTNSSRLEKYFLSEFLGFDQDRRDSDGSVGSDSEGRPSPEAQRRKRLVRARGTGRSHSSSLDNLLSLTQTSQNNLSTQNSLQDLSIQDTQDTQTEGSSTETDGADDGQTAVFCGTDGQFDTVKRKKKKSRNLGTQSPRFVEDKNKNTDGELNFTKSSETINDNEQINSDHDDDNNDDDDDDRTKTPQPELITSPLSSSSSSSSSASASAALSSSSGTSGSTGDAATNSSNFSDTRVKQQSRDSGFVGSCDDLLQNNQKSLNEQKLDVIKDHNSIKNEINNKKIDFSNKNNNNPLTNPSLSRKDSFNNWSSDEETNLMMSKMRQFFKTMVANSNGQLINSTSSTTPTTPTTTTTTSTTTSSSSPIINNSSGPSPVPSPRLSSYTPVKSKIHQHNRKKPPQLVYFENELTRLMKTVPGIRDEQVREIVEYLSSEDTWSDSYDSSDYTSSDLEGAGGRRSALQEQISQSCQQIINKFDINSSTLLKQEKDLNNTTKIQPSVGRDTAFVYQKLVQSFTKISGDNNNINSDTNNTATPHSSPPLIAKVMHHIGSRLVALMHEVSEGNTTVNNNNNNSSSNNGSSHHHHHHHWRRYSQHHHHRTPSSASTTEDDDTSDSTTTPSSSSITNQYQLPRSKSHDPLLLINGQPAVNNVQEGEEREASDYERFSWRGSFESALMAADSRTKLLACSGDVNANSSINALAMAAKRRSAGDLLFNQKTFSREQLDRVKSCGSIGGGSGIKNNNNNHNNNRGVCGVGGGNINCSNNSTGNIVVGGSIEDKIWNNRRRSSVPDTNTRGESGASADDDDGDDSDDELEYNQDPRATTLPRGIQTTTSTNVATNSLPRLPASASSGTAMANNSSMHKAHSMYHFLPQHTNVKSARYRPPGFARNSLSNNANNNIGPKRAFSAPGLQIASQNNTGKRESSRTRRQQAMTLTPDDGSSLSEACSTPIIGVSPRPNSARAVMDIDDMERSSSSGGGGGLHPGHNLNTRASLSSLGARSDSMASVYSGAGEGRWCGSVAVRGEVEFSLQYDYKNLSFEVHVSQCKDLAPVDIKRNRSDPYVKVYLLPDKSKAGKRKTRVKKHTLNPVFDETLKFQMNLNGLETRTLWLTVWHSDMFGRNDFLGEVRMPLENKIFDDPSPKWYQLQERTEPFDDPISQKGEVIVGLKFVPPDPTQLERDGLLSSKNKKNYYRGSLHVLVKEARNLQTRIKSSGTCDPFCKSYLLPDKGRAGKQKTNVVRRSGGSPVWGHTFIYKDVSIQELAERGLELTVWDHDRIGSNEFLGGVRFNLGTGKHYGKSVDWMDATGRELSLWQNMLERTNFWVEGAVTLRPNLHNHGKNSFP
ncbi:probable serine/threonine-protein kinase DDB_G0282963 isoform X2 [Aphidius gifuensis]|nr:probable serine/threonine-protein kinase DDB_G0282963 isoform X2 [Aphidius gifuensis]